MPNCIYALASSMHRLAANRLAGSPHQMSTFSLTAMGNHLRSLQTQVTWQLEGEADRHCRAIAEAHVHTGRVVFSLRNHMKLLPPAWSPHVGVPSLCNPVAGFAILAVQHHIP